MKIPKPNHWSMELSDYNLTFIHIKDSTLLADAISRQKTQDIYRDVLDCQTAFDIMKCIAEVVTKDIQTLGIDRLHTEQKKDISCWNSAAQNSFKPFMISPNGLLEKQQYIHELKYDVTIAPHSVIPVILHESHNSKGQKGTTICAVLGRAMAQQPNICKIVQSSFFS